MLLSPLRRFLALFIAGLWLQPCAPLFGASDGDESRAGVVAFRLHTNYKAFLPLKALRIGFATDGSFKISRVRPKPDAGITFVSLAPGRYRMAEISTPEQAYAPPQGFAFDIEPGRVTYIGDIHLNIKQGAYKWHVRELRAIDAGEDVRAAIRDAYPEWPVSAEVSGAEASAYPSDPGAKPQALGADVGPEDLGDWGVVVVTLSAKRGGGGLLGALSPQQVAAFALNYRAESGIEGKFAMENPTFRKRTPLSEETEGTLVALRVPSGSYECYGVRVEFGGGGQSWFNLPFSLPFAVGPGEIAYLGEVHAVPVKKKVLFLPIEAFAEFRLADRSERDHALFAERFPKLAEVEFTPQLLQASGDWRQIFVSESDSPAKIAPVGDRPPSPVDGWEAVVAEMKLPKAKPGEPSEGVVKVELIIDERGAVKSSRIVQGMNKRVDKEVRRALAAVRFHPAVKDGKPVPIRIRLPVEIKLPE